MSQLITCPECKKHLQVPDDLIGKKVQCPECKHTFVAEASTTTEVVSSTTSVPKRTSTPPSSAGAKKKAEWDTDDDDDEDEEKERASKKGKPPAKKRRDDDDDDEEEEDDDDDDDDRPRRRRRRSRSSRFGGYLPDRSGQILTYGILSLVFFAIMPIPFSIIFGLVAWTMGNGDLAEIRAGRMDPTNEGAVQTGRILGIVSVSICGLALLVGIGFFCCLVGIAMQQQPGR